MRSSPGRSSDLRAVLASTRAILAAVPRQTRIPYADNTWSPVAEFELERIARGFGCALAFDELGPHTQELGVPGYMGPPMLVINHNLTAPARRLALRHGLAHLVAGELEAEQGSDVRFMSGMLDYMSLEERRADLFAIADLVPDRMLAYRAGWTMDHTIVWLWSELKPYAPAWPTARLADRIGLRMALARA